MPAKTNADVIIEKVDALAGRVAKLEKSKEALVKEVKKWSDPVDDPSLEAPAEEKPDAP